MKRILILLLITSTLILTSCVLPQEESAHNADTMMTLTERQAKELDTNPYALSANYGGSYLDTENEKVVICLIDTFPLPEDSPDGVVTYRAVDFNYTTLYKVVKEIIPAFLVDYPDLNIAFYTHDYNVWVELKEPEGQVAQSLSEYVHNELGLEDDYPSPLKIVYLEDQIFIEE